MLLDSNIVIYAAQPAHVDLRQFIAQHAPSVSVVTFIEVLGYHRLHSQERQILLAFFHATEVLPLTNTVADWAVRLRQRRRMSLADAIIAGTALAFGRTLVTHNTEDFRWISELAIHDALAANNG
ncbi:MAG: type II toxin-antitoxin system VapC family toxin [Chloroflexi bacterium]|nr:type II toxin-antitoxin system VapC family toxin [Chloroflexota bacterium]